MSVNPAASARCILVVEDDFDIRDAVIQILTDEGYRVVGAANGQDALERLRAEPNAYGLILLDLMMPVMDGRQFRAEQERDPALAAIPVVVMSADASVQVKATSIRAADCLRKPIQLDTLLATIARFRL
jgi:CheY-like chemotaxis protein